MRIRTTTAVAFAAALTLGAAACTQAEQENAEVKAEAAGDQAQDAAA